jgi:hypothetical protein
MKANLLLPKIIHKKDKIIPQAAQVGTVFAFSYIKTHLILFILPCLSSIAIRLITAVLPSCSVRNSSKTAAFPRENAGIPAFYM